MVKKYLDILDADRYTDRNKWLNIGYILYSLSQNKTDENSIIPILNWLEQIDKYINNDDIINYIKNKYYGFFKTGIFKNLISIQYTYYGYIHISIINLLSKVSNSDITFQSFDNKFIYLSKLFYNSFLKLVKKFL